jgi:hypothetical protein
MGFTWMNLFTGSVTVTDAIEELRSNVGILHTDLELSDPTWSEILAVGSTEDASMALEIRDKIDDLDDNNYCRSHNSDKDATHEDTHDSFRYSTHDSLFENTYDNGKDIPHYTTHNDDLHSTHQNAHDNGKDTPHYTTHNDDLHSTHRDVHFNGRDDSNYVNDEASDYTDHDATEYTGRCPSYNSSHLDGEYVSENTDHDSNHYTDHDSTHYTDHDSTHHNDHDSDHDITHDSGHYDDHDSDYLFGHYGEIYGTHNITFKNPHYTGDDEYHYTSRLLSYNVVRDSSVMAEFNSGHEDSVQSSDNITYCPTDNGLQKSHNYNEADSGYHYTHNADYEDLS